MTSLNPDEISERVGYEKAQWSWALPGGSGLASLDESIDKLHFALVLTLCAFEMVFQNLSDNRDIKPRSK